MLTLDQAQLQVAYQVVGLIVEVQTKKQLNHLGLFDGKIVTLLSLEGSNGILLVNGNRLALDRGLLSQIKVQNIDESAAAWQQLSSLSLGDEAYVVALHGDRQLKRRLLDMGMTKGTLVQLKRVSPLGDPLDISIRGYDLTLRKSEADQVVVMKEGTDNDR